MAPRRSAVRGQICADGPLGKKKQRISLFVRLITLGAAEVAFVALVANFVIQTWKAKAGVPPDLPAVQADALAGLALLLGDGYGVILAHRGKEERVACSPR